MSNVTMFERTLFYMMPMAEVLIGGYCLYRFAKPFAANKNIVFCSGAAYSLMMIILYIIPVSVSIYAAYGIAGLAAFLIMCRVDCRNYYQKAFVVITCFSLGKLAYAMAEILYDSLYSLIESTGYIERHPDMSPVIYACVCIFYLVVGLCLTAAGILLITKTYADKYPDMGKKELIMSVIPSFVGVTGYEIMHYYRNFYIMNTGRNAGVYDAFTLLYCAVSVITVIVVIVLYQSIRSKQEENIHIGLLATQIESIKRHIDSVESLYMNIRGIRHDMTNHVLTLERLYAGNKPDEAEAYLTCLKTELAGMTGEIRSGNPVTDVILEEVKNEAEKRKINFSCEFYHPSESDINVFDMSVILNNALQNALENTRGNTPEIMPDNIRSDAGSYISVVSYRRNNAYMIEICNSFKGKLKWNTDSGLPVTSKGNADGHGYGLSNIRRIAQKYSGDIDIALKDGEFRLCIMLMAEQ